MTVFRNNGLFLAAVAAVLTVAAVQAGPRSLLPVPGIGATPPAPEGKTMPSAPPPGQAVPAQQAAPGTGSAPAAPPSLPPGGIEIGSLRAPDPASVALIGTDRGLGIDMWQGMARADIASLLKMAAHPVRSPALARLFRRLLLTGAEVPPPAPEEAEQTDILALRLQALMAIGDTPSVRQLVAVSPGREDDPLFRRLDFEARVVDEGLAAACPLAERAVADDIASAHTALYWQKTAALCQAVAGNEAAARLAGDLLREEGLDDPRFFALLDLLTGMDVQIAAFENPDIVEAAALTAAGRPQDAVMADRPALLRLTALQAPPGPVRARAALLAAAYGLIDRAALQAAMQRAQENAAGEGEAAPAAVPAPAAAPAAPEGAAAGEADNRDGEFEALLGADDGIETIMDLYAALSAGDDGLTGGDADRRGKLLLRLLALGERQGVLAGVAMLARDIIAAMPADGARAQMGLVLARASLAAGDADVAYEWLKALQRRIAASRQEVGGAVDQQAVAALLRLWPLFQIADPAQRLPTDPTALEQWVDAVLAGVFPPPAVETALTLFAVTGTDAGDAAWKRLEPGEVRQGLAISPAGLRALKAAVMAGHRAEAVLLILHFMGDWPAGALDRAGEGLLVHALFRLGLTEDARRLASEILLADGF